MSGFFSFLVSLFWWALIAIVIAAFFAFKAYNRLQALGQRLRESASNMEVAVSRKLSLINQLIDVVRNYQDFEQFTHLKIAGDNTDSLSQAWSQSGQVLASIQGLAQKFPELRSSDQYSNLAASIQVSEQAIMEARERYNASVRDYNTARCSIPTVFFAKVLGFTEAPYLEFDHSGVAQVSSLKEFKTGDSERLQQLLQGAGTKLIDSTRAVAAGTVNASRALQERLQVTVDVPVETVAETNYFYMQAGGVPQGPVTAQQLHALRTTGAVSDETLIAQSGSEEWAPLSELEIA